MYNYFESKESLLEGIVLSSLKDIQTSFEQAEQGQTAQEKLELLVKSSFDILGQKRDFWKVFYSLRAQPGIKERVPVAFLDWHVQIQKQLQTYLQDLGHDNPEGAAWLLFATIDGVAQHWIWQENYPLDKVLNELLKTYRSSESEG